MTFWRGLALQILTPQTARFILALLSLLFASLGAYSMLQDKNQEAGNAAMFAIGQLFALATIAFGYYFGSTARGDDPNRSPTPVEVANKPDNPVPVQDEVKP